MANKVKSVSVNVSTGLIKNKRLGWYLRNPKSVRRFSHDVALWHDEEPEQQSAAAALYAKNPKVFQQIFDYVNYNCLSGDYKEFDERVLSLPNIEEYSVSDLVHIGWNNTEIVDVLFDGGKSKQELFLKCLGGSFIFSDEKEDFLLRSQIIDRYGDDSRFDKYQELCEYKFLRPSVEFFDPKFFDKLEPEILRKKFDGLKDLLRIYQSGETELYNEFYKQLKNGVEFPCISSVKEKIILDNILGEAKESHTWLINHCSDKLYDLRYRDDYKSILENIPENQFRLAAFFKAIYHNGGLTGDALEELYQKFKTGKPPFTDDDLVSFNNWAEGTAKMNFADNLMPLNELGVRKTENGVDIIALKGQPFNLLVHDVIRWHDGSRGKKDELAEQFLRNPKLFADPNFYYDNYAAITGSIIKDGENDHNTLSCSLLTDKHIETFGGVSVDDARSTSHIIYVYNDVPPPNILSAFVSDAGTNHQQQYSVRYIGEMVQEFPEFESQIAGRGHYNEVVLSRQRINYERDGDCLKRTVQRDDFIKPCAVLLPVKGRRSENGFYYKKREEDSIRAAKELGIPIIELHLDNYKQEKNIDEYVPKNKPRFEIDPNEAIEKFYELYDRKQKELPPKCVEARVRIELTQ